MTLRNRYICVLFCGILLLAADARGQVLSRLDSIKLNKIHFTHSKFVNNIFQQAINSVKKSPDAGPDQAVLNGKSEDPYLPYQGKIIRHIYIDPLNFDRSFEDTSKFDNSFGTRVGKRFHKTTHKYVIKDNLFIKENTPLNAFKMADNERYLRTLEYIRDARIIVEQVKKYPDSVDVIIYTKDFFSIAGGAAPQSFKHIDAQLYETNLAGMGSRLDVSGLYESSRNPEFGYGASYRIGNFFHSFMSATVGYNTIGGNPVTREQETSKYIAFDKRLVSPYSRTAGGLTLSRNTSYNIYNLADSLFFKYKYDLVDVWAGYSIGIRKLTATNNSIRDRRFFSIRYSNKMFSDVPKQVGKNFDPIYNNTQLFLGQFTFFRQDYYKTQYIYGFGTTEDFPYGYNISVTAGWQKQLGLERPYAGFNVSEYIATNHGDFISLYLKSGGYLYNNKVQDGSVLIGGTLFSRIMFWNTTKIRQYFNLSYTHLYNRVTYPQLRIDNTYGLRGFLSDSAYGTRRLSMQLETEFYLKRKILGFKFAPFPYADLTLITPEVGPYSNSKLYTSLGGGVRARNENLIFQTIEVRAYFFPNAPTSMKGFKVIITDNVRFRYSSNYVSAPDVVQLNRE